MQIKLSSDRVEQLEAAKAEITRQLRQYEKARKDLEALASRQEEARASIVKLERGARIEDNEAISTLETSRATMRLAESRFPAAEAHLDQSRAALKMALLNSNDALQPALSDCCQQYLEQIASTFRPYFISQESALNAARNSDAAQLFRGLIIRNRAGLADIAAGSKAALQEIEQLLSGKLDWQFDPEQSA